MIGRLDPGAHTDIVALNVIGNAIHRHVIITVQKHRLAEYAGDKLRIAFEGAVVAKPGRIQCVTVELP